MEFGPTGHLAATALVPLQVAVGETAPSGRCGQACAIQALASVEVELPVFPQGTFNEQ